MDEEDLSSQPEPTPDRSSITTTDDGRARTLTVTGLALLVNIMRIGQHRGRPAICEELDEKMQAEVRHWARSVLAEEGNDPVACQVKACCLKMLEDFEEDGAI